MKCYEPRQVAEYREKTKTDKVPTIGFFTFKCKCCGGIKAISGRKKLTQGWKCKECVTDNSGETS